MKTLEDFIALVAEQFDNAENIEASTEFRNLDEYSSLTALSLIAMIDEEFEVTIKGDDLKKVATVEELYNMVRSRMQ